MRSITSVKQLLPTVRITKHVLNLSEAGTEVRLVTTSHLLGRYTVLCFKIMVGAVPPSIHPYSGMPIPLDSYIKDPVKKDFDEFSRTNSLLVASKIKNHGSIK